MLAMHRDDIRKCIVASENPWYAKDPDKYLPAVESIITNLIVNCFKGIRSAHKSGKNQLKVKWEMCNPTYLLIQKVMFETLQIRSIGERIGEHIWGDRIHEDMFRKLPRSQFDVTLNWDRNNKFVNSSQPLQSFFKAEEHPYMVNDHLYKLFQASLTAGVYDSSVMKLEFPDTFGSSQLRIHVILAGIHANQEFFNDVHAQEDGAYQQQLPYPEVVYRLIADFLYFVKYPENADLSTLALLKTACAKYEINPLLKWTETKLKLETIDTEQNFTEACKLALENGHVRLYNKCMRIATQSPEKLQEFLGVIKSMATTGV